MKRSRWLALAIAAALGACWVSIGFAAFVDNGNGTVSDTVTGLMWQKGDSQNDAGGRTWEEALNYCESLTLPSGGYSDWRLPNVRELETLVDWDRYAPAINTTYFPDCRSSYYWSSSTYAYYPGYAWTVDFYNGYVYSSAIRRPTITSGACAADHLGHLAIWIILSFPTPRAAISRTRL